MYFPSITDLDKYPVQTLTFGNRFTADQTVYEYLLEFLQVMISPKTINDIESNEYFPIDITNIENCKSIKFKPEPRIGLKRFIFFKKSKHESRYEIDEYAYNECINALGQKLFVDKTREYLNNNYALDILQNLLYGFNAVIKNRSWFAQSLLPVCPEVIMPESMGKKNIRKSIKYISNPEKIDNEFEFHNYNFMSRGGEIYYLHIFKSLLEKPSLKGGITNGFNRLITCFPQFSELCIHVEKTWNERNAQPIKPVIKTLGFIPGGYDQRGEYSIRELNNFLETDIHPFEKIDVLSYGIVLQIIRMMHEQASYTNKKGAPLWIIDMNSSEEENKEMKKLAIRSFASNEENITNALYVNLNDSEISDKQTILSKAATDTYKLCRKLGKAIGMVVPINGPGMRFTLSEKLIKFLVLSIIPPSGKLTLDTFVNELYHHYGMIISRENYKLEMDKGNVEIIGNFTFFDKNKALFIQKLKDCGFLRDLSDATSIVENPYSKVEGA